MQPDLHSPRVIWDVAREIALTNHVPLTVALKDVLAAVELFDEAITCRDRPSEQPGEPS